VKKRFIIIGALFAGLYITGAAVAASGDVGGASDPLFENSEALQVTISGPLTTLVRERAKDNYLRGQFGFTDVDGVRKTFHLRMRTRGNSRHRECDYPPILLNFKKSQTRDTLFDGQNKLKLVIHCRKSPRYEQTVLREYLAYQMLAALTDLSFRVRLLHVSYVNEEREGRGQQRYAFLIEHKKRFAGRVGLTNLAVEKTSVSALRPDQLNLTSVFAFMIGNTDFSPIAGPPGSTCCHNYVLFGDRDEPIVPVAYDFDQSGLVNAPYARPDPRFRIHSVKQRVYRGRCVNNRYVADSLERFRDAKATLYTLVREQAGLAEDVRIDLLDYMEDFYDVINDPGKVQRELLDSCV
jgi:hypothetical protein